MILAVHYRKSKSSFTRLFSLISSQIAFVVESGEGINGWQHLHSKRSFYCFHPKVLLLFRLQRQNAMHKEQVHNGMHNTLKSCSVLFSLLGSFSTLHRSKRSNNHENNQSAQLRQPFSLLPQKSEKDYCFLHACHEYFIQSWTRKLKVFFINAMFGFVYRINQNPFGRKRILERLPRRSLEN